MKIEWKGSPNFHPQKGVKKKFIVFHWMVGTLDSATAHFSHKGSESATNYGVGEGRIHQYVKDKDYAFGSGDFNANKFGISIEHEGGWMQKNGTRKKPTKKTLETSAWLCAKIAREHKMGKLIPFENAFPHKHFVATACPGTLDWKWICKEANRINAEMAVKAPVSPVEPVSPVQPVKPSKPVVVAPVKPEKPVVAKPKDDNEYIVVKNGDSYWEIARRVLGVSKSAKHFAKIAVKSAKIQKLNKGKKLFPNDKVRVK